MALTREDLQAIGDLMDAKLDTRLRPIESRLVKIEKDVAEIKESLEEVRDSTNRLLEWADEVGERPDLKLPKII